MIGRRKLTPEDVRMLVFESIRLIDEAQRDLRLSICPELEETRKRLRRGRFKVAPLPQEGGGSYHMAYGSFDPPAMITLDRGLSFCDRPLDIPEIPYTMAHYTASHEVIHADDHYGGDRLFLATREHILREHGDKLLRGMEIVEGEGGCDLISCHDDLACFWAMQYVDMVTHYRTYVALRHHRFPKLDMIWERLDDGFFPPNMLTKIEAERGARYVFNVTMGSAGEYCLVDALMESEGIREKNACRYTV